MRKVVLVYKVIYRRYIVTDTYRKPKIQSKGAKRMIHMRKHFFFVLLFVLLFYSLPSLYGADHMGHGPINTTDAGAAQKPVFLPMPDPGKKVPIGNGYYLIYGFDKRPKMGMVIMKAEVFTAEGKKDTTFEVKADAGMPSMSGAHETGDKAFSLSNKGDYLLPINIVMPGDWEIRLTVSKEGKVIFRGRYNFNV